MSQPRVIIADTDVDYIIPLKMKFAEEFMSKINLEIITDKDYFNQLFSVPQKADILIVSENLYDYSLSKHNLENIFVLAEQMEEETTGELNIKRIYKYTSLKEIFIEVMGNSGGALDIDDNRKKETQVILVYSAAGGVGKTTLAAGLCSNLARNYKKVLLIGAEHLQTFQYLFENQSPISSEEVYSKLKNPTEHIFEDLRSTIRKESFTYLPPFKAGLLSLDMRYSVFAQIVLSIKRTNEFDYIVIDSDSVFDEDKAKLIGFANKVFVVTKQDKASVFATEALVTNINGIKSDKYIFVCNDFVTNAPNAITDDGKLCKFSVSEYIDRFTSPTAMSENEIVKNSSFQKLTYMIL